MAALACVFAPGLRFPNSTSAPPLPSLQLKPRGGKRIAFEAFEASLEKVAAKKGQPVAEVIAAIVKAGGPKSNGTKAEYNRFFDDKNSWCEEAPGGWACAGGSTAPSRCQPAHIPAGHAAAFGCAPSSQDQYCQEWRPHKRGRRQES